jgi:hypothetical protein
MNPDLLTELAALGVEYTIVGDKNGNARIRIGTEEYIVGPATEALARAIRQHQIIRSR